MELSQNEAVQALEDFETRIRKGATFTSGERAAFAEMLADLAGGRQTAARLIRAHTPTKL
jgi:hypothetical protein